MNVLIALIETVNETNSIQELRDVVQHLQDPDREIHNQITEKEAAAVLQTASAKIGRLKNGRANA